MCAVVDWGGGRYKQLPLKQPELGRCEGWGGTSQEGNRRGVGFSENVPALTHRNRKAWRTLHLPFHGACLITSLLPRDSMSSCLLSENNLDVPL